MKFPLLLCGILLGCLTPVSWAQNPSTPTNETVQSIGTAFWRIGLRGGATGLYVEAPANLAPGGVTWPNLPASSALSSFSASNEQIRVELVRGTAGNFEVLRDAAWARIGGAANAARPLQIASYEGLRLEANGKIGFVVRYGSDVWAVVFLPENGAESRKKAAESAESLWLERREAPQWKDRALGTTSFQADLPFELAPRFGAGSETVTSSARWRGLWVDATEWRSTRTDLDGTVKLQTEDWKKKPGLQNVRVHQRPRLFPSGFIEGGERGHFVQIDYNEGETPRRIYALYSVAGTRVVKVQITLNAADSSHRLAAHRILGTARLGWTDSANWTSQTVADQKFALDSDSPFRGQAQSGLSSYEGSDPLARLFVLDYRQPIAPNPADLDADARALAQQGIGGFLEGAGTKLGVWRVEPIIGGLFPACRIMFEAENDNRRLHGDAALIFTSRKAVFPFRLAGTASSDWARRWATTFRADFQPPSLWVERDLDGLRVKFPQDSRIGANSLESEDDGIRLKIAWRSAEYFDEANFNPLPHQTSPVTESEVRNALGGFSSELRGEVEKLARAANAQISDNATSAVSAGRAWGVGGWFAASDARFPRLDVFALHDGQTLWTIQLGWNDKDAQSAQSRDALIGSLWAE